MTKVTGHAPEELLGRTYDAQLEESERAAAKEAFAAILCGERREGLRFSIHRRDGSTGSVEVNAAPGLRMHLAPSFGKARAAASSAREIGIAS